MRRSPSAYGVESPLASLGMKGVRTPSVGFPKGISSRSSAPFIPRVSAVFSHMGTFERPIQRARSAISGVPWGFADQVLGNKYSGTPYPRQSLHMGLHPPGVGDGSPMGSTSHRGFLVKKCQRVLEKRHPHTVLDGCSGLRT